MAVFSGVYGAVYSLCGVGTIQRRLNGAFYELGALLDHEFPDGLQEEFKEIKVLPGKESLDVFTSRLSDDEAVEISRRILSLLIGVARVEIF